MINYLSRAHRIQRLYLQHLRLYPELLKITSLHGFLSYLLPMRAGDFSLPALLHEFADVPFTRGNTILIRTRLADVFGLGTMVILAAIAPNSIQISYYNFIFLVAGIFLCITPLIGIQILRLQGLKKLFIFQKIFGKEEFKALSLKEGLAGINICFWTGCTFICVIKTINIHLSPFDAWFLSAIQLPLQLIPLQGVANTGTHEVGWTMGLALFGVPAEISLTTAIATHIILFLYICALAAFASLLPIKRRFRNKD